jgi:chorismate mutase/prephenate dehydrogenase
MRNVAELSDLSQLRDGIDECDAQLVALLAKRNAITQKNWCY